MRFHVKYEFDEVDHKKTEFRLTDFKTCIRNTLRKTVIVTVAIAEAVAMQYTLLSFNSHAYMPVLVGIKH